MSYRIIIDLSHNEKLEEFPDFTLGVENFDIEYIDKNEGPIESEQIEDFDILFLGNIQHKEGRKSDKFTPDELKAIKKFVGEGGGLFLTSGEGGDKDIAMKKGSLRVLYKITGVRRFWNGVLKESSNNCLVKKKNILVNDLYTHPLTKGISEVVLSNCTFFTLEEDVEDIIRTSPKAKFLYNIDGEEDLVSSVPVCTASEFFEGRCVTVGSSDFLMEYDFGIEAADNQKFVLNILKWLCFEL